MMRRLILLALIILSTLSFGQNVGIGTNTPDASAKLDVTSTDSGILIPRVSLISTTDVATISSPATSLLVYNTNAGITGGNGTGYYYWNGSEWEKLIGTSSLTDDWSTSGNSGTDVNVNFLGTTDGQAVAVRTNNTEAFRVHTNQNVSIGSSLDYSRLFVAIPSSNSTLDDCFYSAHAGSYTGSTYSIRNFNNSSTNSTKYGIYNRVNDTGTGTRYGIYTSTYQNPGSSSTFHGIYSYGSSQGFNTAYGIRSNLAVNTSSSGSKSGIHSTISGGASGGTISAYAGYFDNNVTSTNSAVSYGVFASGNDYAIYALGNTTATGTKAFSIDHPLDPENMTLKHFAIESNEVLNLYRGMVELDANGEAEVLLPAYFDSININFTYQLTAIGSSLTPYILEEIENNSFMVKGAPNTKVSWEVKANRNDKYIQQNPNSSISEVEKPHSMKGKYHNPGSYGLQEERGMHYQVSEDSLEEK